MDVIPVKQQNSRQKGRACKEPKLMACANVDCSCCRSPVLPKFRSKATCVQSVARTGATSLRSRQSETAALPKAGGGRTCTVSCAPPCSRFRRAYVGIIAIVLSELIEAYVRAGVTSSAALLDSDSSRRLELPYAKTVTCKNVIAPGSHWTAASRLE